MRYPRSCMVCGPLGWTTWTATTVAEAIEQYQEAYPGHEVHAAGWSTEVPVVSKGLWNVEVEVRFALVRQVAADTPEEAAQQARALGDYGHAVESGDQPDRVEVLRCHISR
ncbi:hypothetical protein KUV85_12240 [Nocardioides panacisoli]|uniref:hypothetical protein n=1 Tax=Nocardioides panacisoli TaxID=627624 RepID=UPI001C626FE9|nr:hypothetical protein [Nocardioides panacisoli]QYJ03102.1 hypothetical protein KUV85_12240 [Nocardioides panacisoli]